MRKIFAAAAIFVFAFGAPASAKIKKVWSSSRHKPKWISVFPRKKGYHYFVGISQNQADSGVALQKALEEALKQVLTTIGVTAGSRMRIDKEMSGNKEVTKMIDKYKENSRGRVKGHQIKQVYTEEYRDGDKRFYDVYVLMRYSDRQIKTEQRRIERQQAANRRQADAKLPQINDMASAGDAADAYRESARLLGALADQPGSSQFIGVKDVIKKMITGFTLKPVVTSGKKPSAKLLLNWNSKKVPVSGVKLSAVFETGSGVIASPQITDGTGMAVFPISRIKFDGGIAKFKVVPVEGQFLDSLKNAYMDEADFDSIRANLRDVSAEIVLKAADFGASKFCLIVWNERGKRANDFEVALAKELTDAGISVRTFSNLPQGTSFDNYESKAFYGFLSSQGMDDFIIGRLSVIDNGSVYNLRSVTSQIDIKVAEIKTGKLLAAFQKSNTGVQINLQRAEAKTAKELVKETAPRIIDIAGVQ